MWQTLEMAQRHALLKELNASEHALELFIQARENRATRPPIEAQVIEESVMMYLTQRQYAILLQIASTRTARRMVLKNAATVGFGKADLQAVM